MLEDLRVILVAPRFPENIGMVARACANMGAGALTLVNPERWDAADLAKAAPPATSQGLKLLQEAQVAATLPEALHGLTLAVGTTARTGGWRKEMLDPEGAAALIARELADGGRPALVFGPVVRGLLNIEVECCGRLVRIPTAPEASSLNLAQAVLLLLYECAKAAPGAFKAGTAKNPKQGKRRTSRPATLDEEALLFERLRYALILIDALPKDNPDWFMQPLRRYLRRSGLRRHEFDFLMGVCRQIARLAQHPETSGIEAPELNSNFKIKM